MKREISRRRATGMLGAATTSFLFGEARAEHANVAARVIKLIAEHLGVNPAKITPATRFMEDLGADSLDCVELTMAAEEEFNIEVPDDVAESVRTVGEMIKQIGALPPIPPRKEQKK